MMSESANLEL